MQDQWIIMQGRSPSRQWSGGVPIRGYSEACRNTTEGNGIYPTESSFRSNLTKNRRTVETTHRFRPHPEAQGVARHAQRFEGTRSNGIAVAADFPLKPDLRVEVSVARVVPFKSRIMFGPRAATLVQGIAPTHRACRSTDRAGPVVAIVGGTDPCFLRNVLDCRGRARPWRD